MLFELEKEQSIGYRISLSRQVLLIYMLFWNKSPRETADGLPLTFVLRQWCAFGLNRGLPPRCCCLEYRVTDGAVKSRMYILTFA